MDNKQIYEDCKKCKNFRESTCWSGTCLLKITLACEVCGSSKANLNKTFERCKSFEEK
jgi:hypothetical protein